MKPSPLSVNGSCEEGKRAQSRTMTVIFFHQTNRELKLQQSWVIYKLPDSSPPSQSEMEPDPHYAGFKSRFVYSRCPIAFLFCSLVWVPCLTRMLRLCRRSLWANGLLPAREIWLAIKAAPRLGALCRHVNTISFLISNYNSWKSAQTDGFLPFEPHALVFCNLVILQFASYPRSRPPAFCKKIKKKRKKRKRNGVVGISRFKNQRIVVIVTEHRAKSMM